MGRRGWWEEESVEQLMSCRNIMMLTTPFPSHDIRKSIARVLTVINAKQRSQLRLFYKNKKFAPLDLRPKQTRAIRRRLSPEDKARVLEKQKKRQTHFPQRKYAVKVRRSRMSSPESSHARDLSWRKAGSFKTFGRFLEC